MTAIVAIRDKRKKLYFAGERRVVAGSRRYDSPIPKITKRDGYLLGSAGTSYLCSVIQNVIPLPPVPETTDPKALVEYLLGNLIPEWVAYLRDNQFIEQGEVRLVGDSKDISNEESRVVHTLIGVNNHAFEFLIDTQEMHFDIVPTPYAVGCGGPVGLAALLALNTVDLTLMKKLELAFEIINKLDAFCGKEFDLVS